MHRKWWTLIVVSVATFMLLLDITVVNTALPAIHDDLGASFTELQWVIDAYTLSLAALVLTAGVLADRLGRRRVFAVGLGIFTVASALAGFAPDPTFLNVARAIQGVGGAVMFAVSLALVAQEFKPGRERGVAMGVYGATIGVAVAFGPLVGGALVEGIGWESIFFLNVPIGLAALVVTYSHVQESRDPNASRIDWAGLVTFSTALFLLVLGLIRGNDEGWGSTLIVSLLASSGALMAAFLVIQTRVREPMLPLHFFKKPAFTGVQLAALAVSSSMFSLFLYITFYLQGYLGHEPLEAGLIYLPLTVTNFFVAAGTGALLAKVQARYLMSAGLVITGVGLLLMGGLDPTSDWTALLAGFILSGAGVGIINPVIADVAVSVVPKEQSGMASGINDTFRQVGIAIGIAAWGAIFLGRGAAKVEELAAGTQAATGERPRQLVEAVSSGNLDGALGAVPPGSRETVGNAAREGFLSGMNDILMLGGILAIAGAIAALWLVREQDIERGEVVVEPERVEIGAVPEPVAA
ncbi:MAG: MFS transporter [Thermoleophilaceae bacterium]|nr:MFS transporter [Thermoleophilaceae bacterium]